MPVCVFDNVQMFYEDIGFGEPILFLHSHYNRGILAFACQMQVLHKKYRCLLPDYRGHGRTTSENPDWNLKMTIDDMISFLDSLKINKVHIIGYSCGGQVGFNIAAKYPEKVASFISIGNSGLFDGPTEDDSFLAEALIQNKQFDIINEINRKHYCAHKGDWQGFLLKSQIDANHPPYLSEADIKKISVPSLLIAGDNDEYVPREHIERIKELLPSMETFIVKNGNHRPHMLCEHTLIVNEKINDFLSRHSFQIKADEILSVIP